METVLTKDINACAKALLNGKLVAFGTDTVYGIGAVYNNEQAVKSIYTLKGRDKEKPLNLLVSNIEMAKDFTLWNEEAQSLASAFWGGALTLILPKRDCVPKFVTAGKNTVGVRMPALKEAAELIALCGKPLAVPSANPSGKPSATEAAHVLNYFDGKLPYILDTGKCKGGLESTV
ncbi:MAG: threonylcarbamoyl-AMP synthase, partial [Clostridia bacterium]|nr:threonylcarbamoyl-AMP synthase [Clostridia bacterium]